ncbi:MAG TPA: phenylalanine--tRNA ligase subunit beta [Candidatus Krumholzibacteria bacterium]|nr:phenylalanine--tRNA ligase subunit beta [Candidatus Krumholzibacteria bacterium]HPD71515.1 phenylalanine--tRNA ligase subunit beta [Candidatus Krumholzibacteria bacterium]HRY41552.1 phenylalanine--tRNA ligase subunit beta [Candidatus Krumholzibacteria bacterium]
MRISLNWLRELVSWEDSPRDLAARLTAAGLNVENVSEFVLSWPGVTVARVVSCRRHPDADKLSLCQVDAGTGEPIQVVCGAPNVREGLTVLFATVGTVLPGNVTLRKATIRGVESHGMICSAAELGLGDDHSGIMELPDDLVPGTPADEIFGCRDTVLDIEVTPNRPDWLSHLGVAREIAALYGTKITPPPLLKSAHGGSLGYKVEIENFADCPRYTAHGVDGVTVGPSPYWLQNRLRAIGQRPINNVVDITNYVLFELGHPLHAFDRDRLSGDTIMVRRAGRKQSVTTLDDESRQILADDLIIADGDGPVALAGVMGLANSEVTPASTSLLLESAFFAPRLIRACSRRLGLISESSYRFEREADWTMVRMAAQRALYLLQEHAGGVVLADAVDRADPDHQNPPDLALRLYQVNRVLGTDLGLEQVADLLQSLGLKVQPLSSQEEAKSVNLMVQVPSYRRDLKQEVDLIEEIARLHGFDQGARSAKAPELRERRRRRPDEVRRLVRAWLPALGYHEIVTSSFLPRPQLAALRLPDADLRQECLVVLNPHHGGETMLRTSLVPGFVDVARRNLNAGAAAPVRLFQFGRVFWPRGARPESVRHEAERLLPEEPWLLQIGVAGVTATTVGGMPADLAELKGLADQLADLLRVDLRLAPRDVEPFLAPGAQWAITTGSGQAVGTLGRLHAATLAALDLDVPAAALELNLGRLDLSPRPVVFQEFSRFPSVRRDLSLLVPRGVTYAGLAAVVQTHGQELLESVELFDFYEGKGVPEGFAAYGIRLKFRSAKGSLKGRTVDLALERILGALSTQLGVQQRSQ